MNNHIFKEEQRMRQVWIYILLLAVLGIWLWQLIQQVFLGVPFGTNPAPDVVIVFMGIIPVGAFFLIISLKLETVVTQEGIKYRMWPLIRKYKEIAARDIDRWEVKKYNPIKDYGGWGIRYGWGKNGVAYNISGNQGAYFELKNRKRILIGTRKPEELRSALRKMMG